MERKSNFELLRIFAIILIIGSHLASHGIQHVLIESNKYCVWFEGNLFNRIFTTLLIPGGTVGVALFFMITGYFRINKTRLNLSKLVLKTLFYGVILSFFAIILVVCKIPVPGIDMKEMLSFSIMSFFNPITSGVWWFISAYFFLLLLSPVINKYLLSLNKKSFYFLICIWWFLWYAISSLGSNYFYLERAMFFYVMGVFCRLHLEREKSKLFYGTVIVILWCVGAILQYVIAAPNFFCDFSPLLQLIMKYTISFLFTAFVVPLVSFNIFRFFEILEVKQNKVINVCGGGDTWGVFAS